MRGVSRKDTGAVALLTGVNRFVNPPERTHAGVIEDVQP